LQQLFQTKKIVEDRLCQITRPNKSLHTHVQGLLQPKSSFLLFPRLLRIQLQLGSNVQVGRNLRVLLEQQIFPPTETIFITTNVRSTIHAWANASQRSTARRTSSKSRPSQPAKQRALVYGSFSQPRKTCLASSQEATSHSAKTFANQTAFGCSTNRSKLERFLDVLFEPVLPQKRVANLVPTEDLLKVLRRKFTMKQNYKNTLMDEKIIPKILNEIVNDRNSESSPFRALQL
jgi:hypothetical protein